MKAIDVDKLRTLIFKCLDATTGQVVQTGATIGMIDGKAVRLSI